MNKEELNQTEVLVRTQQATPEWSTILLPTKMRLY